MARILFLLFFCILIYRFLIRPVFLKPAQQRQQDPNQMGFLELYQYLRQQQQQATQRQQQQRYEQNRSQMHAQQAPGYAASDRSYGDQRKKDDGEYIDYEEVD